MNKVPIAVIAVGIIITLAGIFVVLNIEEKARGTVDEGVLYVGANGEMEISGKSNPNEQGLGFYVHIKGTYKGGGEGGYNKERDNNTWTKPYLHSHPPHLQKESYHPSKKYH